MSNQAGEFERLLTEHFQELARFLKLVKCDDTTVWNVWRIWHRTEYFVDLGCAVIPVGNGLTEKDISMFYDDPHKKFFSLLYHGIHANESEEEDEEEEAEEDGRIKNPDVIAQMFDGEAIHKYADYLRVIKSPVGVRHVLWQLTEAGYEADCINDVLSARYGDYALGPPKPKQTFLKYVQSTCEGDISALL